MTPEPAAYEVRYGPSPPAVWFLAVSVATAVIAVAVPANPILPRPSAVALFVLSSFAVVKFLVIRPVAIRADQAGFTLGGDPVVRYRSTTHLFPWQEVQRIIVWRKPIALGISRAKVKVGSVPYIGVERRPGAPPPPVRQLRPDRDIARLGAPVAQMHATAIPTGGCRLDSQRLLTAIAEFAPNVQTIDATREPHE